MQLLKRESPEYILVKNPKGNHQRGAKLYRSEDCAKYLRGLYGDDIDIYESAFLVLLNQANNTVGHIKLSQGGVTGTVMDVRLIVLAVISSLACKVIACHNHPSGNIKPSAQDEEVTRKVKEALKLVDCNLVDHIIITSEQYYSFADEGIL